MNTDTPITDAATFEILSSLQSGTEKVVHAKIARDLERKLAAVTAERDDLRDRLAEILKP